MTCIISTLPPVHIPSYIKLACIVFELSWYPDFREQMDGHMEGRTEGRTDGGQTFSPLRCEHWYGT